MADIEELIGRLEAMHVSAPGIPSCALCGEAAQALRELRDNWREVVRCSRSAETLASNNAELRAENEKLRAVYEAAQRTAKECAEMEYDHTCCCWNWTMLENSQHQCGLCELREALAAIGDEKCRKCGGKMIDGVALMPAYAGAPDFPGDTGQERGCTISQVPSTDANLEGVRKCRECGWSVTGAAIGDDNNSPTEK